MPDDAPTVAPQPTTAQEAARAAVAAHDRLLEQLAQQRTTRDRLNAKIAELVVEEAATRPFANAARKALGLDKV